MPTLREHGGNDLLGQPAFDFSSNANACGPCPATVAALAGVDPSRYPESGYLTLRRQLANAHRVGMDRVVVAASGSEFITRLTALVALDRPGPVGLPPHGYADYRTAALAQGLPLAERPEQAALLWCCEPGSPLGQPDALLPRAPELARAGALVVLDRAYAPLRLEGQDTLDPTALDAVWQLWTPNKALGLPGIRGAYAIAPQGGQAQVQRLQQLAASWLLGAHGLAMLTDWVNAETQAWVAQSRSQLAAWKAEQLALCTGLGWHCLPSQANFFTARPDGAGDAVALGRRLDRLRLAGVKLRDARSFGLPGHVRLSVQPPESQQALRDAWRATA